MVSQGNVRHDDRMGSNFGGVAPRECGKSLVPTGSQRLPWRVPNWKMAGTIHSLLVSETP